MSIANLTELVRSVPKAGAADRPKTGWRDDLVTMAISAWPFLALFADARNHNNNAGQESFWSTAHIVLYTGMAATALWIGYVILKHQAGSRGLDLGAIPVGYGISVLGLIVLGIGGPADFAWHSVYGFEFNVEAAYSPPHLLLFFGGALVAGTGFRAMWAKREVAPGWTRFLPAFLSMIYFVAMLNFFTMYLSPFMTPVAPTSDFVDDIAARFTDVRTDESLGLNPGLTSYGDDLWPYSYYSTGQAIGALLLATVIFIGPVLVMLRRWRPPPGTVTLVYIGVALLVNIMSEYRDIVLVGALVVGGAVIDLLILRLAPPGERLGLGGLRVIGTAGALALWGSYWLIVEVHWGIGWSPELWGGSLMLTTAAGLGVSALIAPPPFEPSPAAEP